MCTIRFGIIGCGLMGREFASAAARWCHLVDAPARPIITAICNRSAGPMDWFTDNFDTIRLVTHDYRELLASDAVDAVYIAVPHHLHERTYIDAVRAGKHLMGEKPFGIDLAANEAINRAIAEHPEVFVRCVSQFPFFPAVQRIGRMFEAGAFGRLLEVETGFLHSSDLDPNKPINWKREIAYNGAYGVMGDLGMHACHVPLRGGIVPRNVRAVLSNIITERYEARGSKTRVPCETWDNATLLIEAVDRATGESLPWTLRTQRISPGQKDSWYVRIAGTQAAAHYSTANPGLLELLEYQGGEQIWQRVQMGYTPTYPTITGNIFEFGFGDAILQMWASFLSELATRSTPSLFAGCVKPEEAAVSHHLFDAALRSHASGSTEVIVAI